MELPREWYSITDLTERWECSREDIEHLFESKHLYPCCRFKTPINARLLAEGADGMVVSKQIVRIEGQHVIIDYDLIEWKWNGGDISSCRLYSQERDQFFLAVNHQIKKTELIVTKKAVLRFEVENNTKADTDDTKSLFKRGEGMQYCTLEEAAELLSNKPTPEWLLQQMVSPDIGDDKLPGSFPTPSVYFGEPILLRARNTEPALFSGWFNVEGMEEVGKLRNGEICFDHSSRYLCLTRDNERYIPEGQLKIPVSKLHIQKEELELFARLTGREIEILFNPPSPASEAARTLKSRQTAEVDGIVEKIMETINGLVQTAAKSRSNDRTINHIRIIKEAGVPPEKFDSVREKVKREIKAKYEAVGFKPLSRRPKDNDPYFLP
ncbi:hypothetical protein [Geobacter sp. AOG1]|uniref:hypothetical protein n=1 Tax=Geobacter sp. AOG1 TaxID=1566346 RepID=UPI001CC7A80B|nr:hypothetical protein [Geobacter sp. AOG1]GFE56398.1 hypothetical protein AOG1_02770 [Geobacter sp. AOG1]